MAHEVAKLQKLYRQIDQLASSGDDVVADLRKEINSLELAYLRDKVIPKVAALLSAETKDLRCNIDCNLQSMAGQVDYTFCSENSPFIKGAVTKEDFKEAAEEEVSSGLDKASYEKLSAAFVRISELADAINECKDDALSTLDGLTIMPKQPAEKKQKSIPPTFHEANKETGLTLFVRSSTCNASGKLLSNREIVILKGSILRTDATPTYGPKEFRKDILSRFCTLTDEGYLALQDLPPMSVSGASGLCLGRSSNGNVDWKDKNGTPLADL